MSDPPSRIDLNVQIDSDSEEDELSTQLPQFSAPPHQQLDQRADDLHDRLSPKSPPRIDLNVQIDSDSEGDELSAQLPFFSAPLLQELDDGEDDLYVRLSPKSEREFQQRVQERNTAKFKRDHDYAILFDLLTAPPTKRWRSIPSSTASPATVTRPAAQYTPSAKPLPPPPPLPPRPLQSIVRTRPQQFVTATVVADPAPHRAPPPPARAAAGRSILPLSQSVRPHSDSSTHTPALSENLIHKKFTTEDLEEYVQDLILDNDDRIRRLREVDARSILAIREEYKKLLEIFHVNVLLIDDDLLSNQSRNQNLDHWKSLDDAWRKLQEIQARLLVDGSARAKLSAIVARRTEKERLQRDIQRISQQQQQQQQSQSRPPPPRWI